MTDAVDEFEFYPCLVDGASASIYLNLRFEGAAERAGADTRYWVTVEMLEAGPHGIGTAEEAIALNDFEEAVMLHCADAGLRYVGRLRHVGRWEVVFYGPAGLEAVVDAVTAEPLGGRRIEAHSEPDASWRYYVELLLPDAERLRWTDDRRHVQLFAEQGDGLVTPRRVDHRVSFADGAGRAAFLAAITSDGFALGHTAESDAADHPCCASVYRTDPIDLEHIHEVVMKVVDAATTHGGRYDRWETSIER